MAERVAIELQQHLDNLLHSAAPGQALSCGTPAKANQYFVDLRLITQLIRASWPLAQELLEIPEPFGVAIDEDHDQVQERQMDHQASLRTLYDTPPLSAKICAALLLTARRLLDCGPPPELTEKVLHLLSYDQRSPSKATWTRDILIRQPDCSPGLGKALAPVLQGYTPVPGRRQVGLNTPVGRTSYTTRHVAQFLQEDWYQCHFARMDGVSPLHLRRAAAIRLCQLAAGGPVSRAAEQLGIPYYLVSQSIKLLNFWVSNRPERREFETALRRLAEELDSAPHLIDYQRRREALARWSIDPPTWEELLNRLPTEARPANPGERGDRGRQAASLIVWVRITQSEPALAPQSIRDITRPGFQSAWRRSVSRTWSRDRADPAQCHELDRAGLLDNHAHALAAHIDRGKLP